MNDIKVFPQLFIELLAENALDAACAYIQDELGQKHGDVAGVFFSGKTKDIVMSILESYICTEINFSAAPPPVEEK
jgi:hypothetical protein